MGNSICSKCAENYKIIPGGYGLIRLPWAHCHHEKQKEADRAQYKDRYKVSDEIAYNEYQDPIKEAK